MVLMMALAQQKLIDQWHERVVHGLAERGDQLSPALPPFLKESLGQVAPIPNPFTRHALSQGRDGLAIVDVTGRNPTREPHSPQSLTTRWSLKPSNQPIAVLPRRASCLNAL